MCTTRHFAIALVSVMIREEISIASINASADVGEYLGFKLNVTFDSFNNKFVMNVKGAMSHPMEVGTDPLGNITRINNSLEAEPERKLADRPAERTSLKGKLSEMKARVSGTPAGRDAVDKTRGKEEVI